MDTHTYLSRNDVALEKEPRGSISQVLKNNSSEIFGTGLGLAAEAFYQRVSGNRRAATGFAVGSLVALSAGTAGVAMREFDSLNEYLEENSDGLMY